MKQKLFLMVIAFFAIASAMTSALALPSYDNNGTVTLYNSNSGYWTDAINNGYLQANGFQSQTAGDSPERRGYLALLSVPTVDIGSINVFGEIAAGNYLTFSVPPTAAGDEITSIKLVLGDYSNGGLGPWTLTYKDEHGTTLGSFNIQRAAGSNSDGTTTTTTNSDFAFTAANIPARTTSFTLVGTNNFVNGSSNRFFAAQYVYEPASSTELGVTITGNPIVGQTLTANVSPSGATVTYQWEANGSDIAGAVNSTYIPVAGDVGKTITITVTGTGSYAGTATSAATSAVTNAAPAPPYDVNGTVTLYNSNSGYWTNAINNGYLKMSSDMDGLHPAGNSTARMDAITALGITAIDIQSNGGANINIYQPQTSGNYITFCVPPTAQGDVIMSITLVLVDYSGGSTPWTITYNDADGNHIGSTEIISAPDDPHVYTNTTPPTGTTSFTLVGTSNGGSSRFYAAQYVYEPAGDPAIARVTVSPSSASVNTGATQQFTATVNAVGGADKAVTWSVSGQSSGSTAIDQNGLLTVGSDETAGNALTVTATSDFDNGVFGSATVTVTVPRASATFYVSSQNGDDATGDGSLANPWQTIAKVNSAGVQSDDKVCFERGGTYIGNLVLKSVSGVILEDYGTGALPIIDGTGGTPFITNVTGVSNVISICPAIYLWNASAIQILNLEVTNSNGDGVIMYYDSGMTADVNNMVISGCTFTNINATGTSTNYDLGQFRGAVVEYNLPVGLKINGFEISNNTISNIHGEGVMLMACGGDGTNNTVASTLGNNIQIHGNTVTHVYGDGITVKYASNSSIDHNTITYADSGNWLGSSGGGCCGTWFSRSTGCVIEYNVITDGTGPGDGEGFGFDNYCHDNIAQYNYTSNNVGGAFYSMPTGWGTNIYRYNLSVNDGQYGQLIRESTSAEIYNNTFYTKYGVKLFSPYLLNGAVNMYNNIFYLGSGSSLGTTPHSESYNCFYGPVTGHGTGDVNADPLLSDPTNVPTGIDFTNPGSLSALAGFKLMAGSPCIGTGKVVTGNGGFDFWGNAVSGTAAPNIGAYEGPGLGNAEYAITVTGGTANLAQAAAGVTVTITAGTPPAGKVFDHWESADGVTFAGASNPVTTFTMLNKNVSITAVFDNISTINRVDSLAVRISVNDRVICIENAQGTVKLSTIAGITRNYASQGVLTSIPVQSSGEYIVNVNQTTQKVLVK